MKKGKMEKIIASAIICTVLLTAPGQETFAAPKTESADTDSFPGSVREEALEEQIMAYFDAISEGDLEKAKELRGTEDRQRELHDAILKENGLEGYENICIVIYPVGENRVVFISSGMKTPVSGKTLAGLETWIAEKGSEGGWMIHMSEEKQEQLKDVDMEQVSEYAESDNMRSWMAETDRSFWETLETDPALENWLADVVEDMTDEMYWNGIYYEVDENDTDHEAAEYIVKRGDCLWRIAENELGGGILWTDLYTRNKAVIGDDPDLILPGMELELF